VNRLIRSAAWLVLGMAIPGFAQAEDSTWVSLFDGKSLEGWTALELGKEKGKSHWEVKDGMIEGTGMQSMLYSPRGDYKNFRFRAELKINDGGNSGMYIRAPKEATFAKGYEIQVNSTHKDPIKTGSVYTYVHVYKQLVPPDTFFTQEVEAEDKMYRGKLVTHIKVKVNDELLYEYLDHDRAWTEGYFAFQQHDPGSKVTIRKVEVIELPAAK
jgi:3-keto-disaccharide hydrolase